MARLVAARAGAEIAFDAADARAVLDLLDLLDRCVEAGRA